MLSIINTPDAIYDIRKWNKCSNVKNFTYTTCFQNLFTLLQLNSPFPVNLHSISAEIQRLFLNLQFVSHKHIYIPQNTLFVLLVPSLYFCDGFEVFQISITTLNGSCTFFQFSSAFSLIQPFGFKLIIFSFNKRFH